MKASHLLLLLALNCGWAAVPTLAKRLEHEVGPLEFVLLRYGSGAVALLLLWPWLPGRLPRGRDFWLTCVMGIAVFTLGHWAQIEGIQRSQASDASILLALDPLVSTLGAAIFLHERIPARRWLGFGCAIAGVGLMSWWHRTAPLPGLLANLLIVLSFVAESVWSVMGKPMIERWGIPKVTALALVAGTFTNLTLYGLTQPPQAGPPFPDLTASGAALIAVLGAVFTAFGYSAWYWVIRETPVSVAALTIYLQPILGTALALFLTQERLHPGHALGAVAIVVGLAIGLTRSGPTAESRPRRTDR